MSCCENTWIIRSNGWNSNEVGRDIAKAKSAAQHKKNIKVNFTINY